MCSHLVGKSRWACLHCRVAISEQSRQVAMHQCSHGNHTKSHSARHLQALILSTSMILLGLWDLLLAHQVPSSLKASLCFCPHPWPTLYLLGSFTSPSLCAVAGLVSHLLSLLLPVLTPFLPCAMPLAVAVATIMPNLIPCYMPLFFSPNTNVGAK